MNIVIALDPGFGNTKVCFDGQTVTVHRPWYIRATSGWPGSA